MSENIGRQLQAAMHAGRGVLRLVPTWVPRSFLSPGRRLRLDPRDLYALGAERGGIDERWFASTVYADNGPGTPPDEGLSYVRGPDRDRFLLADAIAADAAPLVGDSIAAKYGRWPVFAKFYDNSGPIPHHLHQRREHAALVGREPKPEAYYFPPQMNQVVGSKPLTFFGLEPGTSRPDVRACLERWSTGDNGILALARAFALEPGTGWLVPPGILHAPGTMCTFEPQWGSDVFAMFQSMVEGQPVDRSLLIKDVPTDRWEDLDFIVDLLDWEANVDPTFKQHHFLRPQPVAGGTGDGVVDRWVVYGRVYGEDLFAARELTLQPESRVTLHDPGASGVIVTQGCGRINDLATQVSTLIRFGEDTADEFFFTATAATEGITIENTGSDDLVLLRYFGPGVNAGMPEAGTAA